MNADRDIPRRLAASSIATGGAKDAQELIVMDREVVVGLI